MITKIIEELVKAAVADNPSYTRFDRNSRTRFKFILAHLDRKGITVNVNTIRPTLSFYKYQYEVAVDFENKRLYKSRNSAKRYVVKEIYAKTFPKEYEQAHIRATGKVPK